MRKCLFIFGSHCDWNRWGINRCLYRKVFTIGNVNLASNRCYSLHSDFFITQSCEQESMC